MVRPLGRLLKIAGLIIAPLAMFLQMGGVLEKGWQELAMLAVAVCLFMIGHLLETSFGDGRGSSHSA